MKAKEAAEWVVKQDKIPEVDEVEKLVPEYSNALPRRAWVKTFLSSLPPNIAARYRDL